MKRSPTVDAARAALYALGALPQDQQAAFEERLRTSPALRNEVDALHTAAAELALAPAPVAPPPEVRERLLMRIRSEASATAPPPAVPDLLFALHADEAWLPVGPGIERCELARTAEGASYLLRVAPGSTIPDHDHPRVEHSYVLSGSIDVEGTLCRAGDYHRAAIGTVHTAPHSLDGCLMLVVEASS